MFYLEVHALAYRAMNSKFSILLALVVQKMDSAIRRLNHYPVDKSQLNQLRYPMDSDLSGG